MAYCFWDVVPWARVASKIPKIAKFGSALMRGTFGGMAVADLAGFLGVQESWEAGDERARGKAIGRAIADAVLGRRY